MQVGDRVKFIGPEYKSYGYPTHPRIGHQGVITERRGYHMEGPNGEDRVELITIQFDGDPQPTVVAINRIALIEKEKIDG